MLLKPRNLGPCWPTPWLAHINSLDAVCWAPKHCIALYVRPCRMLRTNQHHYLKLTKSPLHSLAHKPLISAQTQQAAGQHGMQQLLPKGLEHQAVHLSGHAVPASALQIPTKRHFHTQTVDRHASLQHMTATTPTHVNSRERSRLQSQVTPLAWYSS